MLHVDFTMITSTENGNLFTDEKMVTSTTNYFKKMIQENPHVLTFITKYMCIDLLVFC